MAGSAKLDSFEALRDTKVMLATFAEETSLALVAIDADIARVKHWLNSERPAHWRRRIRELEDAVEAAKAEIRRKEIVAGNNPISVVDERKKLRRAQARLEEAQRRAEATRRWGPAWERESMLYKSSCTPLTQAIQADIPRALTRLEKMMDSLEGYLRAEPRVALPNITEPATPDAASNSSLFPILGDDSSGALPDYRTLRDHVPPVQPSGDLADRSLPRLDWPAGEPSAEDCTTLSRLSSSQRTDVSESTITLAWRATTEPSIFFVRTLGCRPLDSGWYVGPVHAPHVTGGLRVCTVAELLKQHSALAPVFSLGTGSLLVLTRGVIKAVLDANDRDLWANPSDVGT